MKNNFTPKPFEKCGGKNCYPTRIEAEIVAREQEILGMQKDLKLKVYRCINCGQWHLSRVIARLGDE